jgi:cell division protein FtsW (lipid II flippase)
MQIRVNLFVLFCFGNTTVEIFDLLYVLNHNMQTVGNTRCPIQCRMNNVGCLVVGSVPVNYILRLPKQKRVVLHFLDPITTGLGMGSLNLALTNLQHGRFMGRGLQSTMVVPHMAMIEKANFGNFVDLRCYIRCCDLLHSCIIFVL